eukprot:4939728-Pleurochrysis_carterae.AAC.1
MEPQKNIALLVFDKETDKTVEISPVSPALNFTQAEVVMFTRHTDIIHKALLFASFNPLYDDPYDVKKYKLLETRVINVGKNTIRHYQEDFFPDDYSDDESDDEAE